MKDRLLGLDLRPQRGVSASSRATLSVPVSDLPVGVRRLLMGAAVDPVPNVFTQSANVPGRSSAMPLNVAPGVDSNRSTACRWDWSVSFFLAMAMAMDMIFSLPQPDAGCNVSKIRGQAPQG